MFGYRHHQCTISQEASTTLESMPKIPPELVDNVIDFLHDDPLTLRSCSIVCSNWVASTRTHIFRCISLDAHPDYAASTSDCQRLHAILRASPHIASYIKHLVIHGGNAYGINDEHNLPLILKTLTSLERLDINPEQLVRSSTIWSDEFLDAISFVVSSHSFRELRAHACTFHHPVSILHILRSCHQLKFLHLTNIGFLPWTQGFLPASVFTQSGTSDENNHDKGRIQRLSIDHPVIARFFVHPLSPVDVSDTRDLTLKIYGEFSGADTNLLNSTPLLERLEIDLMTDIADDHLLDLGNNSEIKSLILQVPLLLDRFDPLPWLFALFSSIPEINSLEELVLSVTIDLPPPHLTVSVYEASLVGWKNIDVILAHPKFSALSRIRLDFALDNPIEDKIVPTIIDDILSQLDALNDRGILYVDTCEIR